MLLITVAIRITRNYDNDDNNVCQAASTALAALRQPEPRELKGGWGGLAFEVAEASSAANKIMKYDTIIYDITLY